MTVLWTSDDIAQATGGAASAEFVVHGVAFDSREVGAGDLFVAMVGDNDDGHRFVDGAVARGADVASFTPLLASAPETMQAMLEHVDERYGSVIAYLELIGLDAAAVDRLRARLVDEPVQQTVA